jgi:predicted DNA-binding protein
MLTIELEPELEVTLNALAQKEHSSPSDIIKQLINAYIKENQESELLVDIAKTLPKIACFENKGPLELQKAMRDEWN